MENTGIKDPEVIRSESFKAFETGRSVYLTDGVTTMKVEEINFLMAFFMSNIARATGDEIGRLYPLMTSA